MQKRKEARRRYRARNETTVKLRTSLLLIDLLRAVPHGRGGTRWRLRRLGRVRRDRGGVVPRLPRVFLILRLLQGERERGVRSPPRSDDEMLRLARHGSAKRPRQSAAVCEVCAVSCERRTLASLCRGWQEMRPRRGGRWRRRHRRARAPPPRATSRACGSGDRAASPPAALPRRVNK